MTKRPTTLDPKLGYVWVAPLTAMPLDEEALWEAEVVSHVEKLTADIVEEGWRVDHIRNQIENLGIEAKGRTRHSLAKQLATRFLDASRMTEAVQQLSDEERRYYVTLMLQATLQRLQVIPEAEKLWQGFTTPWPKLSGQLIASGLSLTTEEDDLLLPIATRQSLPDLALPFPIASPPQHAVSSPDPRELLTQIQQLLGLMQVETYRLRERVRWKAPDYPYAQSVVSWPIAPADAQKLIRNINAGGSLELWPPEPYPQQEALEYWAKMLDTTLDYAEWLYTLLVEGGLIQAGDPVTVDGDRGHSWMALAPGRQLKLLFDMYHKSELFGSWWPAWREAKLHVSRHYQGFWGLMSIDGSLYRSVVSLRCSLLEILSSLPEDTWLTTKDLLRWFRELFPSAKTHRHLMGIDIKHKKGGWQEFLDQMLLLEIKGPLRAFGLVEVGPSLENIEALRIHGLRDLQWDRVAEVPLEAAGHLQKEALRLRTADEVLEVASPVPPEFMTLVLQWARPSGFSRNLMRYQLDVGRLHQAFEAGEDPTSLGEAWKASVGFAPLPEIEAWWSTWWDHYGHVRLYPAQAMLETRDAMTMEELQVAYPDLQSSIVGALTHNAMLLRDEDVDRLLADLTRQGYMPKELS
jgi:hypothetical protein